MGVRSTRTKKQHALILLALWLLPTCKMVDPGSEAGTRDRKSAGGSDEEVTTISRALTTPPTVAEPALLDPEVTGALAGGGSVAGGQYSYTIPIDVPKGRAGMQPSVALRYSSAGVEGMVGLGWSLAGAGSFIARCGRVTSSGKQTDFVRFNATDRYCLDGAHLVLAAGTYGAIGSEYRTEVDSFTKVVLTELDGTDPRTFLAYYKDGRIGTFSRRTDRPRREVLNADGSVASTTPVSMIWHLTRVVDRANNAMKIVYVDSADSTTASASLPDYIEYTICDDDATCAYPSARRRRVQFAYVVAGRPLESYTNGVLIKSNRLLTKITTSVGNSGNSAQTKSRVYLLRYDTSVSTGRSLLRGVKECEGTETICLPETVFTWRTGALPSAYLTTSIASATKLNLVKLAAGNKRLQLVPENAFNLYDANGDGNDDVVLKSWATSNIDMSNNNQAPSDQVLLSNGNLYFGAGQPIDPDGDGVAKVGCGGSEVMDFSGAQPVDLDGDGRKELVVTLSAGCPFVNRGTVATPDWTRVQPGGVSVDHNIGGPRNYGTLSWDKANMKLKRAPGGGPVEMTNASWDFNTLLLADLNGDGLPDLLDVQPSVNAVAAHLSIPGGPGQMVFNALSLLPLGPCPGGACSVYPSPNFRPHLFQVMDENGDGRAEMVFADNLGTRRGFSFSSDADLGGVGQLWYQKRVVKAPESTTFEAFPVPTGGGVLPGWGTPNFSEGSIDPKAVNWYPVDVNGDGLKDALYATDLNTATETWKIRINTGAGYKPPADPGPVLATLNTYPINTTLSGGVLRKRVDNGLRVADMNGDGREDLILLDPLPESTTPPSHGSGYQVAVASRPRVAFSNGTGFDVPVYIGSTTDTLFLRQEVFHAQLGDINGDGLPELVDMVAVPGDATKRALVVRTSQISPETITSVADERGTAEIISYDSISAGSEARTYGPDGDTHTPDSLGIPVSGIAPCQYPARCIATGIAVRNYVNNRGAREQRSFFRYFGARADTGGRGSLGFARTQARDLITGFEQVSTADQSRMVIASAQSWVYPALGEPKEVRRQYFDVAGTIGSASLLHLQSPDVWPLTITTTTLTFTGYPVRLDRRVGATNVYEITEVPLMLRYRYQQTTQYDAYGNAVSDDASTQGNGARSITSKTETGVYDNTAASWLIGLPRSVTTTTRAYEDSFGTGCSGASPCATTTQITEYEYDAKGLVSKIHRERARNNDLSLTTELVRDANGVVTSVRTVPYVATGTPPNARTNSAVYDESGVNLIESTNPLGHKSWFMYYAFGDGDWSYGTADQNGSATKLDTLVKRDKLGRPREVTTDEGNQTIIHNAAGVTRLTVDGVDSATFYDTRGRPVLETWTTFDDKSAVGETIYNALGASVKSRYIGSSLTHAALAASETSARNAFGGSTGGNQTSASTFDRLGRAKTSTNGVNETSTFTFPSPIGKRTYTDPAGDYAEDLIDQNGKVRWMMQRLGGATPRNILTYYGYDDRGLLGHVKGADNGRDVMTYDVIGRMVERRQFLPAGGGNILNRRLAYTSFDEVAFDYHGGSGSGSVAVSFTRDDLGRVIERKDANATTNGERQVFDWDPPQAIGSMIAARAYSGTVQTHGTSYSYDTLGRRKEARETFIGTPETLSYSMGYDSKGRVASLTYPESISDSFAHPATGGLKLNFSYKNNMLEYVRDAAKPVTDPAIWQAQAREVYGPVTAAKDSDNAASAWVRDLNTTRLLTHDVASGAGPQTQAFQYYPNGLLKKRFKAGVPEEFFYDGLHRLSRYERNKLAPTAPSYVVAAFAYDDVGNITSQTTTGSNAADWPNVNESYSYTSTTIPSFLTAQTVGSATTTFVPDDVGRVFQHQNGAAVSREYGYNTVDLPTRILMGAKSVAIKYGGVGQRVRKTTTEADGSIADVLYVGGIYEQHRITSPSGTVTGKSVYRITGEDGVLAEVEQQWTPSALGTRSLTFLHNDHQGSPVFRTSGTTATTGGFYPFGKQQDVYSTSAGYTGHTHDTDLGLINMGGRIFDIGQRRFISRDPLGSSQPHAGALNPYAYALNDPINRVDPSGFSDCDLSPGTCLGNDPTQLGTGVPLDSEEGSDGSLIVAAAAGAALLVAAAAQPVYRFLRGLFGGGGGGGHRGPPPPPSNPPPCASTGACGGGPSPAPAAANGGSGSAAPAAEPAAEPARAVAQREAFTGEAMRRTRPGVVRRGGVPLTDRQVQQTLDMNYDRAGLDWGRRPTYDPHQADSGVTHPTNGVSVGPSAFTSDAMLRSTLLHENIHVGQLRNGQWGKSGVPGLVNELEAYRHELVVAERTGLSLAEQNQIQRIFVGKLNAVGWDMDPRGALFYLKQIFMGGSFMLRPEDAEPVLRDHKPSWIWPTK